MSARLRCWLHALTGRDLERRIVALERQTMRIVEQIKHDK
jgi:hypothetical protein